jgi:hypothetical protein
VAIGFGLYLALYVGAEQLVHRYARQNRFYAVSTASLAGYDFVILGASHAAVFDYADMNARLQERTGARIVNLSVVGGGVTVNRLLLDYFLATHTTRDVIYFLDSFAFYSAQWNEDRLRDVRLFDRAPFDPLLVGLLLGNPSTRLTALDYVSGFSKINNPERFAADINPDEATRFEATYRPVGQIDSQRLRYLYPVRIDQAVVEQYLAELRDMQRMLTARGTRLMAIKPPLPERFYRMLPEEARFDEQVGAVLAEHGGAFIDFSLRCNDERYFYNTDHLNRAGVLNFYDECFVPALSRRGGSS